MSAGKTPRYQPQQAREVSFSKSKSSGSWLARNYSVPARIVTVLGVLASGIGLVAAVGDTEGENPLAWLMFLGPGIAGAFPTLELAWHKDRDLSMATVKARWFIFPTFGALGAVVVMALAEIVMRITGAVAAAQAADKWHYWFALDGPSFPSVMFGILGYVAGLLFAIAFFVLVLWPMQIFLRPRQAIAENMMDTSESNFRRNRAALALMPPIVINAFVIATALTLEIMWLAAVAVVVEVALVVVAMFLQRVDKRRRAAAGQPTGVELGRKSKP